MILIAAVLAMLAATPEVTRGSLQLTVAPPIGGNEPLLWELRKRDGGAVRSGTIEKGAFTIEIANLDAGLYRLLIKGREPLQQHISNVRITDAQVTETHVAITPLVIEGTVTLDGVPLDSPKVVIAPHDRAWEAKLTASGDGRFAEELWQRGKYNVSVSHDPAVRVWGTTRSFEGDGRVQLDLRVPNRRIRGRVIETKTGAPIEDVIVSATMPFGDKTIVRNRARTAADGTFEFTGVEAGDIELSAVMQGYRSSQPIRFTLRKDEPLHEEQLVLEQLPVARTVSVIDARGLPLAGAMVLDGDTIAATDAQGRATVYLASADERPTVFAVPRSGSFGFARLIPNDENLVLIQVRDSASLDVRMESVDREPIARAGVQMRINGTVIPSAVFEHMARMQGIPLYTDAAGRMSFPRLPPGQYDLRPMVRKSDPKPDGPVSLTVLPGPQTVLMKFTAR